LLPSNHHLFGVLVYFVSDAFYDDCWYENDIRRHRKLVDVSGKTEGETQSYYGPPIVSGERKRLFAFSEEKNRAVWILQ
jgi:hypothetical protein